MTEFNRTHSSNNYSQPNFFIYEAIVRKNYDPLYQGSLEVEIIYNNNSANNYTDKPDSPKRLVKVSYLSPFYGFSANGATTGNSSYGYGFWATPPDVGSRVLVLFAEGNDARGYWVGCIPEKGMHFSIPDIAAATKNTQPETGGSDVSSQKFKGKKVPVNDYDKTDDSLKLEKTTNPHTKKPDLGTPRFKKTIKTEIADALYQQGLLDDETRGVSTSSAQRESPSNVSGMSTPGPKKRTSKETVLDKRLGGTSLVFDDGNSLLFRRTAPFGDKAGPPEYVTLDEADGDTRFDRPHDELFRIRTRTGHQILLHNSEDLIYVSNSRGTTWIELTSEGKIDIFASDSISIHSDQDINFSADRDFNVEAGRNVNIKTSGSWESGSNSVPIGRIRLESFENTELLVNNNLLKTVKNDLDIDVTGTMKTTVDKDFHLTANDVYQLSKGSTYETSMLNWSRTSNQNISDTAEMAIKVISKDGDIAIQSNSGRVDLLTLGMSDEPTRESDINLVSATGSINIETFEKSINVQAFNDSISITANNQLDIISVNDITMITLDGSLTQQTFDGKIVLANYSNGANATIDLFTIGGDVSVQTMSGDIQFTAFDGNVMFDSKKTEFLAREKLLFTALQGDLNFQTFDGALNFTAVGSPQTGGINIVTTSGDVRLQSYDGDFIINSLGDINMRTFKKANITAIDGLTMTTYSGNLTNQVLGTGELNMSTYGKIKMQSYDDAEIFTARNLAIRSGAYTSMKAGYNITQDAGYSILQRAGAIIAGDARYVLYNSGYAENDAGYTYGNLNRFDPGVVSPPPNTSFAGLAFYPPTANNFSPVLVKNIDYTVKNTGEFVLFSIPPLPSESVELDPLSITQLPKIIVKVNDDGTIEPPTSATTVDSILARMPQHEPWPHHENLNPSLFVPENVDRESTMVLDPTLKTFITPDPFGNETGSTVVATPWNSSSGMATPSSTNNSNIVYSNFEENYELMPINQSVPSIGQPTAMATSSAIVLVDTVNVPPASAEDLRLLPEPGRPALKIDYSVAGNGPLATIKSKKLGVEAHVAKIFAPYFQGFINDLEDTGYTIQKINGYNRKKTPGSNAWTYYSSGAAIDINPPDNTFGGGINGYTSPRPRNAPITDMPPQTMALAEKWGLGWGGNMSGVDVPMYFSVARRDYPSTGDGAFDVLPNGRIPYTIAQLNSLDIDIGEN